MLLRVTLENIFSFKDVEEFNLFPSSKSKSHESHKVSCGHATALRMSALYGANGAGKSNLINAIGLLQSLVIKGELGQINFPSNTHFLLSTDNNDNPSGIAIEFSIKDRIFYYHLEFDTTQIYLEELYLSTKTKDELIFKRSINNDGNIEVELSEKNTGIKFTPEYKDAIQRVQRKDMSILNFMGQYFAIEYPLISLVFSWFKNNLRVLRPEMIFGIMPQLMHTNENFVKLVNEKLPIFKTGIDSLTSISEDISAQEAQTIYKEECDLAKKKPGEPVVTTNRATGEVMNIVLIDGQYKKLSLQPQHKLPNGNIISTPYFLESDGTKRMVEYMPILYFMLIDDDNVFIIDEIERSVHPILIKELVRSISESNKIKGQLVFSTHESCLLDQSIFRPDEIWFAQKGFDNATHLYPLSDFNIHKTANIENGYLQGRYGGIPFLANLKDLNW